MSFPGVSRLRRIMTVCCLTTPSASSSNLCWSTTSVWSMVRSLRRLGEAFGERDRAKPSGGQLVQFEGSNYRRSSAQLRRRMAWCNIARLPRQKTACGGGGFVMFKYARLRSGRERLEASLSSSNFRNFDNTPIQQCHVRRRMLRYSLPQVLMRIQNNLELVEYPR